MEFMEGMICQIIKQQLRQQTYLHKIRISDGNRPEISTSIIGGPHRFDNRCFIEMRTFMLCGKFKQWLGQEFSATQI